MSNKRASAARTIVGLLVPVLAFIGCNSPDQGNGGNAASKPAAVTMELVAFKPDVLQVSVGSTVTWTQKDPGVHTVTSGTVLQGEAGVTEEPDGRFDSKEIPKGETFSFTFNEPGTYPYFCSVHPATMRGEVRVE